MSLALVLSRRTVLVSVEVARAVLGVDAETIYGQIDCGGIRWAWDIACQPREIREVRVWARELIAPDTAGELQRGAVIEAVIGTHKERLRAVEVGQLLICSRPHIHKLVATGDLAGPLAGGTQYIERESLAQFLNNRMMQ